MTTRPTTNNPPSPDLATSDRTGLSVNPPRSAEIPPEAGFAGNGFYFIESARPHAPGTVPVWQRIPHGFEPLLLARVVPRDALNPAGFSVHPPARIESGPSVSGLTPTPANDGLSGDPAAAGNGSQASPKFPSADIAPGYFVESKASTPGVELANGDFARYATTIPAIPALGLAAPRATPGTFYFLDESTRDRILPPADDSAHARTGPDDAAGAGSRRRRVPPARR